MQIEEWVNYDEYLRYQLLARMSSDCDYFLGYGGRNAHQLWTVDDVPGHIQNMKNLWNTFPINGKPVWLTWEEILDYEIKMLTETRLYTKCPQCGHRFKALLCEEVWGYFSECENPACKCHILFYKKKEQEQENPE